MYANTKLNKVVKIRNHTLISHYQSDILIVCVLTTAHLHVFFTLKIKPMHHHNDQPTRVQQLLIA